MEYFSVEKWRNFITTKLIPIRDYAVALLNFWNFLKSLEGKYISEVLKDFPEIEIVFLGGTDEHGYKENSFAKAVKEIFGACISVSAYYSHILQKLEPKVPVNNIEKTREVSLIKEIKELSEEAINISGSNSRQKAISENEFVNHPSKVLDGFVTFLQLCLDVCVGYSPYTTFIWNIRKITRKYLEGNFPEVKNEEIMEFLKTFLGLREILVPNVDNEKTKRDYTIFGFPDYASQYILLDRSSIGLGGYQLIIGDYRACTWEWLHKLEDDRDDQRRIEGEKYYRTYKSLSSSVRTLGGRILNLNEAIWELLEFGSLSSVLEQIPNPKKSYIDACKQELAKIGWKIPEYIKPWIGFGLHTRDRGSQYFVDGALITKEHEIYIRTYSNIKHYDISLDKPFFIFLDEMMPAIFLGVYELVFRKDKEAFVVMER